MLYFSACAGTLVLPPPRTQPQNRSRSSLILGRLAGSNSHPRVVAGAHHVQGEGRPVSVICCSYPSISPLALCFLLLPFSLKMDPLCPLPGSSLSFAAWLLSGVPWRAPGASPPFFSSSVPHHWPPRSPSWSRTRPPSPEQCGMFWPPSQGESTILPTPGRTGPELFPWVWAPLFPGSSRAAPRHHGGTLRRGRPRAPGLPPRDAAPRPPPGECGMLWPPPQGESTILPTPGRTGPELFPWVWAPLFPRSSWAAPRHQGGTLRRGRPRAPGLPPQGRRPPAAPGRVRNALILLVPGQVFFLTAILQSMAHLCIQPSEVFAPSHDPKRACLKPSQGADPCGV